MPLLTWGRQQLKSACQCCAGAWGTDWGVEDVEQALLSFCRQLVQEVLLLLPAAVLLALLLLVAVWVLLLLRDSQGVQALVQQHPYHVISQCATGAR
jgi:uncharacterized membrane protein